MTKENKRFVTAYQNSNDYCLEHVYKSHSYAKEYSFNRILEEMYNAGGCDMRIISHSCNFYSCAYRLGEYLVVHTPSRRILINLEDYEEWY